MNFQKNTSWIRLFLVIIFAIAGEFAGAQSWKAISRQDTLNYKRSNSTVPIPNFAVRVISEEISGSDTILNMNKLAYEIGNSKALINQPIFLQKKIIIKPNGLVVLSDTATYQLYPSARIGANWLFNPSTGVTAVVISINSEDVLGIPDSVKTISLSDGNLIKISKKWGICSFPEFKNPGVNFLLTGIDNQRIGEIFPNHVDFANSIFVGDGFYFEKETVYTRLQGPDDYSWTIYKYIIDSKEITDTAIIYSFSGVSRFDSEYESGPYVSYCGTISYPLTYNEVQKKSPNYQIIDAYPGEYYQVNGGYLLVTCSYDTSLRNIRKVVGGTPYYLVENDTLYNNNYNYEWYWYCYHRKYTASFGIPAILWETDEGDYFNQLSQTFYIAAWNKPWGNHNGFTTVSFSNEVWPVISRTDTMNYQRGSTPGEMPDESIWVTSEVVTDHDTILNLNKSLQHTTEDYYVFKGSEFLSNDIHLNNDKSVLLMDSVQYKIYPTALAGSFWEIDEVNHINAFVESTKNEIILGLADKTKTIKLSNGTIIKLSKNWGIYSFPDIKHPGNTYDLVGIGQNSGGGIIDHTDFALGWEVGNLYRTREGRIENLNNGTINEYITHKQFEVKGKTVLDSTVRYLVTGYRWEEMPQEPIRYYPYIDILEFSLEHAPFVGHEGLGKMQDKFDGDTLITRFNGNPYIHAVELYYDSLFQTTGKRLFGPPFQAIRNDTLIPATAEANSLFNCSYNAIPGFPTLFYSDDYYSADLDNSQTVFMELVAWSTPDGGYGEFITNPLGLSDMDLPENVSVFPNPFRNILNIDIQQNTDYQRIEIYDSSGFPIYFGEVNKGLNQQDLSKFADGFYFMKIFGPDQIAVVRIVKMH